MNTLNQVKKKHLKEREKWAGQWEGDPQSGKIYCRPPNAQMLGVTFQFRPDNSRVSRMKRFYFDIEVLNR